MEATGHRNAEKEYFLSLVKKVNPRSSRSELNAALDMLYDNTEDAEQMRLSQMGRVYLGRLMIDKSCSERARQPGLEPMSIVDAYIPSLDDRTWTPARYVGAAFVPAWMMQNWRSELYRRIPRIFGEKMAQRYDDLRASALYTGAPLASDLYPNLIEAPPQSWIVVEPEHIPVTTLRERDALELCSNQQQHVRNALKPLLTNASITLSELRQRWLRFLNAWTETNIGHMMMEAQRCIRLADAQRTEAEIRIYGRALGEVEEEMLVSPEDIHRAFAPIHEILTQVRKTACTLLPKRDTDTWRG